MPCIRFNDGKGCVGIITVAGPDHYIKAGGKEYTFEWHDYHGPTVLGKRGDPLARQPGPHSPFWLAIQAWCKQGKRIERDWCIWDQPKPSKVVHLGGKHYEVVEAGDDWFDGIEVITAAEAEKIRAAKALVTPLEPPCR